jgi:hypothetical protein
MPDTTLTLDGIYATAGDDPDAYEAPVADVPPSGSSSADLDALLAEIGAWHPLVGVPPTGERLDQESALNSAILAGLVSP